MPDTASALSLKWRAAGRAALRGGAVWWLCGCVETSLVILLAGSKNTLAAAIPGLGISANTDFISPVLSVGALMIYPLAGAALCGIAALLIAFTRVGSRAEALLIDRNARWPPVGILTLAIAVGINVAYVGASNAPVLLAALAGGLYLAASGRVAKSPGVYSKHPLTAILALLGLTVVASGQAPFWVRLAIDLAYVGGLAAVAGALDRLHPPSPQASAGQAGPRVEIAAGALACTMVALALTPLVRIAQWEPSSNASDHRPNVILITLDTVRADHLSLYGYGRDTTPGLRHLPATVYANASATSNWTVPTIASILTGQSPLRHGAEMSATFPEGSPLALTSVTIAEVLQREGYHTAAIVANSILDPELGFDRGFSSYDLVAFHFDDALTPISREYLLREAVRGLAEALIVRRSPVRVSADAGAVNTKTGRLLETLARRPGPFFLFLNYMDAHSPYAPPPPYDTRYPGKDPAFRWITWGSHPLRDREGDHLTSQYDGAIAYLDDELGHLIERLRQLDLFDNSLIVIVGDHGGGVRRARRGGAWVIALSDTASRPAARQVSPGPHGNDDVGARERHRHSADGARCDSRARAGRSRRTEPPDGRVARPAVDHQ